MWVFFLLIGLGLLEFPVFLNTFFPIVFLSDSHIWRMLDFMKFSSDLYLFNFHSTLWEFLNFEFPDLLLNFCFHYLIINFQGLTFFITPFIIVLCSSFIIFYHWGQIVMIIVFLKKINMSYLCALFRLNFFFLSPLAVHLKE